MDWYWPSSVDDLDLPGYHPLTVGDPALIRQAATLMLAAHRPVFYVGGGVLKARAAEALRALAERTGIPVVTTLMARGRLPRLAPPGPGHARHARPLHRGDGHAAQRPAHQPRSPLRRPGDREDRRLRPGGQDHPRRHRPGRAGQGPHGRRRDRRGLPAGDRGTAGLRRRRGRLGGPGSRALVDSDPPVAGAVPALLRPTRRAGRSSRRWWSSSCATPPPDDAVVVAGVGQHQMWASQYWQFELSLHLGQFGWGRDHGLRRAGRHRGQGGPARPDRVGHRRRRLLPDDGPGTGHGHARSRSRSRSPS